MAENRQTLALELRQIIQADRMAVDIIDNANATRKSIEKDTEKKKAQISAEAETRKADMIKQVQAEQAEALAARKKEMQGQFSGQRKALTVKMKEHHDEWVSAIVGRITEP